MKKIVHLEPDIIKTIDTDHIEGIHIFVDGAFKEGHIDMVSGQIHKFNLGTPEAKKAFQSIYKIWCGCAFNQYEFDGIQGIFNSML